MSVNLAEKIQFELVQIEKELIDLRDILARVEQSEFDRIILRAMAGILHSFYNGIEKVFLLISKNIDNEAFQDLHWHKNLLIHMGMENNNRKAVISGELVEELVKYLSFRHYFRHSYGFTLDWDQLKPLGDDIFRTYSSFKLSISGFMEEHPDLML